MNVIGFMPGMEMLAWEPERMCDFVREAGYDGIEPQAELLCADSRTDAQRARFFRAAQSAGLTVTEVVLQRDFVLLEKEAREAQIGHVIRNVEKLAECGVDTVNMFTGPRPWVENPVLIGRHVSEGQAWEWVFEAFDRILPVAERAGVRIALENVWCMLAHNLYTNMFLQRHYDSPMLGVNLDPSHDLLDGISDMRFLVKSWGGKIFHIHLKDAVGTQTPGRFIFPLLGEGQVDWTAFFGALREIGYQGAMSVEFESWDYVKNLLGGRYELAAPLTRRAITQLMENAKQ